MSIRQPSFQLDVCTRWTMMEYLYGFRHFDFSSLEARCFDSYVRKLFCYENFWAWYDYSIDRLVKNPNEHEIVKEELNKCKQEILDFERDSNFIPLLKLSLSRLGMMFCYLKFEDVVVLSDDEWRTGLDKCRGFSKVNDVFYGAIGDSHDWFNRTRSFSTTYELTTFIEENPNATIHQIKNHVQRNITFQIQKDELDSIEDELERFQYAISKQESDLKKEAEKAKQKEFHLTVTIVISTLSAFMWQAMNQSWWLGIITFPMLGYLCFVHSLFDEKKNVAWQNCLSLHKQFCEKLKRYIRHSKDRWE